MISEILKNQICLEFACDTWALKLHPLTPSGDKEIVGVCKDSGKNGELVLAVDMYHFWKEFLKCISILC